MLLLLDEGEFARTPKIWVLFCFFNYYYFLFVCLFCFVFLIVTPSIFAFV